jgi:Anti-sigma-D factor RsdA to sigma factor binding region
VSSRPGGPRRHEVDSGAVARDDALVEALARREPVEETDEVTSLLVAWCAAVDSPPAHPVPAEPAGVDPVPAVRTLRRHRRRAVLRSVATAAVTLLGLSVAGLVGAEQATPGSPFWPLTRIVDHDRARSLAAFHQADDRLDHAVQALENGRFGTARNEVAQARRALAEVRPGDGRDLLAARLDSLQRRLAQVERARVASPSGGPVGTATPGTGTQDGDGDTGATGDGNGTVTGGDEPGDATPTPPPADTGGDTGQGGDGQGRDKSGGGQSGGDHGDQRGKDTGGGSGNRTAQPTPGVPAPVPEPVAPTSQVGGTDPAPTPDRTAAVTGAGATDGGDADASAVPSPSPEGVALRPPH